MTNVLVLSLAEVFISRHPSGQFPIKQRWEALAQMAGELPDHQSVFINNIVYRY